jgi:hypothetical protein
VETVSTICLCSGVDASDIWPFLQNTVDIINGHTDQCIISSVNCVEWLFGEFRIGDDNHLATFVKVVILQAQIPNTLLDICESIIAHK